MADHHNNKQYGRPDSGRIECRKQHKIINRPNKL